MKMLIVDEDRLSRLLLSRALEKAGYGTERGKGKRDSESGEPIILMICDLTMPGTDGLAFLAEIRGWRSSGGCRFPSRITSTRWRGSRRT